MVTVLILVKVPAVLFVKVPELVTVLVAVKVPVLLKVPELVTVLVAVKVPVLSKVEVSLFSKSAAVKDPSVVKVL